MSDEAPLRVLCVDDEPRVLEGLENVLCWSYDCRVAVGAEAGLATLAAEGPFAVVISDMRMPGMNGADFLARVRAEHPDAVRLLLTGYAELESAIEAVNRGAIFRFLQKPCAADTLRGAVDAAAERYRLRRAEQELLADTLGGAIRVLTDVLHLAAPSAFVSAHEMEAYVRHAVRKLGIPKAWQYEAAASLSQLGCITLPPDTLERVQAGQPLSSEERAMLAAHPGVGHDLLAKVPRLDVVAEIVRRQHEPLGANAKLRPSTDDEEVTLGVALLRVASEASRLVGGAASLRGAMRGLAGDAGLCQPLVQALADFEPSASGSTLREVNVAQLLIHMVLDEDVRSSNGNIVVTKGRTVDRALLERLRNFASGIGLVEPFRVRVPTR